MVYSVAKPKNFVFFAYLYVSRSPVLFYDDFCMNLYFVDSDEAMKQGDEVLNALRFNFYEALNPSSLHCYKILLSIKHFIAITF
jgi:hypothetical protein